MGSSMIDPTAILALLVWMAAICTAFVPSSHSDRVSLRSTTTTLEAINNNRRDFLTASIIGVSSTILAGPSRASSDDASKILVLGGTGMVGSQVVQTLQEMGIPVVATSTDGRDGTVALDFRTSTVAAQIEALAKDCAAVISCVGVIGTPDDAVVNSGTGVAATAAQKAGVKRFAYISVAPEVREFGKELEFLQSYMEGKAFSESSIQKAFDSTSYTLIEPTFIYGGDKFALNPPRVASGYGQLIEGLLSSAPLRAATHIAPQGIIQIALEPPVSATAVAKAAVAGVLGKSPSAILDTHDKIMEASTLV